MKMLTVSLLVCALMAMAATEDVADDVVENAEPEGTEAPNGTVATNGTAEPETTATPEAPTEPPAQEFSEFQCRLYGFVATPMDFADAEKHCQTMGANLVSVHSKDEYQYLLQLIHVNHVTQEAWVGGSDCQKEGVWLWTDGSAFEHKEWCEDRPDSDKCHVQNCLQMNYGGNNCWDDTECDGTRSFVCAKPLPCCPESPCPVEEPSDQ